MYIIPFGMEGNVICTGQELRTPVPLSGHVDQGARAVVLDGGSTAWLWSRQKLESFTMYGVFSVQVVRT